ncbi:glycosyltransferase family 4 protein [Microbacterium ureisolvens]|uniref:glycosyltransferase family 4 protein n=1 Tax=Microbacterium ureisolvens TaxID=2781186 RepID=UPI00363CE33A
MTGYAGARVAMIFPSKQPLAPNQWSGTPFGLKGGFESLGAEVVPIGHFFPPGVRQAEAALARIGGRRGADADRAPSRVSARRWSFQRQLNHAGALDLVLAMVTEGYRLGDLRVSCPVVTYDDGTYQQIWRHPDSDVANGGFAERDVQRWIRTQRDSLRAADVACVSTDWAKQSVVDDYGVPADRVAVVGMGHRPRTLSEAGRDWSVPTFLFVGVDWRRKNGDRVLRAFDSLRAEVPGATLHLVGEHEPVRAPGVVDHGLLHKNDPVAQATLDELFARATAFVLPSLFDPSPIAYLEAASVGLPVIATSQGGAGSLLGEAALVVDPHDDEAILGAMRTVADPDTAQRMGAAALLASREASWTAVAERILRAGTTPRATRSS